MMKRPKRNTAYWLASHGFVSQLSYTTLDHLPRAGTAASTLGPPLSITNQENNHRLKNYFSKDSLFQVMPGLYWVDKNQAVHFSFGEQ